MNVVSLQYQTTIKIANKMKTITLSTAQRQTGDVNVMNSVAIKGFNSIPTEDQEAFLGFLERNYPAQYTLFHQEEVVVSEVDSILSGAGSKSDKIRALYRHLTIKEICTALNCNYGFVYGVVQRMANFEKKATKEELLQDKRVKAIVEDNLTKTEKIKRLLFLNLRNCEVAEVLGAHYSFVYTVFREWSKN